MLNPDNATLEWCAKWIEDSLRAETNERTIEFGTNMAMTIRAVKKTKDTLSPASAAPVVDGISWPALLAVLERLKSKTRNPAAEWYHGWNAALQCLINDINARSTAAATAAPVEQSEKYGPQSTQK